MTIRLKSLKTPTGKRKQSHSPLFWWVNWSSLSSISRCGFFHVPYAGLLVFPERWNSSCSTFKGLITSRRSSAPLYEIARKAEQAGWQQKQPAYSKARDPGGDNITALPHHKKKKKKGPARNSGTTRVHGHVCTLRYTSNCTRCWRVKNGCIKGIWGSSASPVAGRGWLTHGRPCGPNTPTLSCTHQLFAVYFIVLNGPHRNVFLHCIFNTKEKKKGSRHVTIFM